MADSLTTATKSEGTRAAIRENLQLALLLSEKCELQKAAEVYAKALSMAKRARDTEGKVEAINGLLRLAGEALNEQQMLRWERDLDQIIAATPGAATPMVWWCKAAIARQRGQESLAQRHFHRYLRAVRRLDQCFSSGILLTREEMIARAWVMLAWVQLARRHPRRAQWLAEEVLRRYEKKNIRSVNANTYLLLGLINENRKEYDTALQWLHRAHTAFLAEHNWYYHLYVLKAYARVARVQQNYPLAYWHLDLLDKVASGPAFGRLRSEIAIERHALEQDAVDLLIDCRKGVVSTRENNQISLRKQYVLLDILTALTQVHSEPGIDGERGLTKAEIIQRVWHESYLPEAHDNKLYYNINRLRKLIEPDMRAPQYLLNCKEGYRLAPGLRVRLVGALANKRGEMNESRENTN